LEIEIEGEGAGGDAHAANNRTLISKKSVAIFKCILYQKNLPQSFTEKKKRIKKLRVLCVSL